jgi:8-oxo-dGTP pyrophosphatase MutT (NUDIX family)
VAVTHRIAAGAVVVHQDRILLVRYREASGSTFLVAPGGGALAEESVAETLCVKRSRRLACGSLRGTSC